jgi:uncharacterized protein YbjQ (UPF0145 family)
MGLIRHDRDSLRPRAYVPIMASRPPPVVHERMRRLDASGPRNSLLPIGEDMTLESVGFRAVTEVMGCVAAALSEQDLGSCGMYGRGRKIPVRLGGGRSGVKSVSYVRQLRAAYATALDRLATEAVAAGADGVVGIELTTTRREGALHEIVALGTAVRSVGPTRPRQPFTTDLLGRDVAGLLLAGWVPVALHVAVELGLRHDDLLTMQQASPLRSNPNNVEVSGFTEAFTRVRSSVRQKLKHQFSGAGADGGLVTSMQTTTWHQHCVHQVASDRVVRVVAAGTSIARFGATSHPGTAALPILSVRNDGRLRSD